MSTLQLCSEVAIKPICLTKYLKQMAKKILQLQRRWKSLLKKGQGNQLYMAHTRQISQKQSRFSKVYLFIGKRKKFRFCSIPHRKGKTFSYLVKYSSRTLCKMQMKMTKKLWPFQQNVWQRLKRVLSGDLKLLRIKQLIYNSFTQELF